MPDIIFNPARDLGPRTTASSASEGRLRVSTGRTRIKKRKLVRDLVRKLPVPTIQPVSPILLTGQGGKHKKKY